MESDRRTPTPISADRTLTRRHLLGLSDTEKPARTLEASEPADGWAGVIDLGVQGGQLDGDDERTAGTVLVVDDEEGLRARPTRSRAFDFVQKPLSGPDALDSTHPTRAAWGITGFPVALCLAWVYDIGWRGVLRTRSLDESST